jgi:hypothetical protein
VPGAGGTLTCQSMCSNTSGSCTVDADCCAGLHCYVALGSTSGTCGAPPPPPVGYDAGPPPPTPDGGSCAFYGQACAQSSDCCNGIMCTAANGTLCNGASGCVCANPVQ